MSKKDIDVNAMLFGAPAITSEQAPTTLVRDPVMPIRMPVTIDNLVAYWGNPRTQENPEFEAIKESIRNRGLDHAPNITRRNPSDPYMIKDGGNTRLKALQELWGETRDPRFYTIDCMFFPWTSERDILVAHIIENEMRGGMSFIDRARAAMRLKKDLEDEKQIELGTRELARELNLLGWALQQPTLIPMLYAHNVLLPHIPNALEAGMGRPTVSSIRKQLEALEGYWIEKGQTEPFSEVWPPAFKMLDEQEIFELDWAIEEVEKSMAERLAMPVHTLRAEMQVRGTGSTLEYSKPLLEPENPNTSLLRNAMANNNTDEASVKAFKPIEKKATSPTTNAGGSAQKGSQSAPDRIKESAAITEDSDNTHNTEGFEFNQPNVHEEHYTQYSAQQEPESAVALTLEDALNAAYRDVANLENLQYFVANLATEGFQTVWQLGEILGISEVLVPPNKYTTAFHLQPMPEEFLNDHRAAWYFWLSEFARDIGTVNSTTFDSTVILLLSGNDELFTHESVLGHYQIMRNQFTARGNEPIDIERLNNIVSAMELTHLERLHDMMSLPVHQFLRLGVAIELMPLLRDVQKIMRRQLGLSCHAGVIALQQQGGAQ